MTEQEDKILRDAAGRNGGAVLSVPDGEQLRHCKSRLLNVREDGLLLQAVVEHRELVDPLIGSPQDCLVAFKDGLQKVGFVTRILEAVPQWQLDPTTSVDALLLALPKQIKVVQRRAFYRAKVAADSGLQVRVWQIEEWAYLKDAPARNQEISCEVHNISVGGLGVRLIARPGNPPLTSAQRLRIQLKLADQTLIMEGRLRDRPNSVNENSIVTGIVFKKLERDVEGRQILSHITNLIGNLQREELRLLRVKAVQLI
jgi:c-di-GMP-binding flagellar brake protein YcgR